MHPHQEAILTETRRHFFLRGAKGIAGIALGGLLAEDLLAIGGEAGAVGGLGTCPISPPRPNDVSICT